MPGIKHEFRDGRWQPATGGFCRQCWFGHNRLVSLDSCRGHGSYECAPCGKRHYLNGELGQAHYKGQPGMWEPEELQVDRLRPQTQKSIRMHLSRGWFT